MKRSALIFLLASGCAVTSSAQSIGPGTINAAGGGGVIGTHEFDWSVGEMTLVSTFTNSNIIVTQGVLQPYDGPTRVINTTVPASQLKVFPNPATSVVNIQYTAQGEGTLAYRLLDMEGRVIKTNVTDIRQGTSTEQLNVYSLAAATYMLEVTVNGASVSTFKIRKLN